MNRITRSEACENLIFKVIADSLDSTPFSAGEEERIKFGKEYVTNLSPKMPASTKKAWVKRLRSGKYTRIPSHLKGPADYAEARGKDNIGYCCLGVLAEMRGDLVRSTDITDLYMCKQNANEQMLPPGYANLPQAVLDGLAEANDSGHTFDHIADFIEKYL